MAALVSLAGVATLAPARFGALEISTWFRIGLAVCTAPAALGPSALVAMLVAWTRRGALSSADTGAKQ